VEVELERRRAGAVNIFDWVRDELSKLVAAEPAPAERPPMASIEIISTQPDADAEAEAESDSA